MPQNVPTFELSEDAVRLRQHVFEFWCEQGRGPTLREVNEALALDKRAIVQAYKALELGIIVTIDADTQNCNLLKAPPFSSFPSQVAAYIDDRFHSFVGCASEAVAVSHMPPFEGKELRLESFCACCLAPITLVSKNFELQSVAPEGVRMHISSTPWDWNNYTMLSMCDSMNFVLDADHAERYERQACRRGVLLDLEQAKQFVEYTANQRMWNEHWPPQTMLPEIVIQMFDSWGVDTTNWKG